MEQLKAAGAASGEPFWQLQLEQRCRKQLDSDIAGTMKSDSDDSWPPRGATGCGARLLGEFIINHVKK